MPPSTKVRFKELAKEGLRWVLDNNLADRVVLISRTCEIQAYL
jgi:hypothetical protein